MFLPLWFAESILCMAYGHFPNGKSTWEIDQGTFDVLFWASLSTSKICEYLHGSKKVSYVASLNDHEWSKGWGKQNSVVGRMGDGMRRSGMFEELAAWVARIYALQKCCQISMISKFKHLLGENHPPGDGIWADVLWLVDMVFFRCGNGMNMIFTLGESHIGSWDIPVA